MAGSRARRRAVAQRTGAAQAGRREGGKAGRRGGQQSLQGCSQHPDLNGNRGSDSEKLGPQEEIGSSEGSRSEVERRLPKIDRRFMVQSPGRPLPRASDNEMVPPEE